VTAKRSKKKWTSHPDLSVDERGPATLYTPEEAANYLGRKPRFMRDVVAQLLIPYVKVGGRVRFRKADLDAYIDANTFSAAGKR
jgi:excisionase family DNA binding protein